MSDNVVKFRRPEKQPEPPQPKRPRGPMPGWVPFACILALAVIIYVVGQAGLFG